jgi:large subunit ribosomal protein L11
MAQCRDIAEQKIADLNTTDLDEAQKMIAGSARSMGFEVRD